LGIGSIQSGMGAMQAVVEMFARAEALLLRATESVAEGEIVDAAISLKEAKLIAAAGGKVARVAEEVSGYLLDVIV